jgi:hypothetical protein
MYILNTVELKMLQEDDSEAEFDEDEDDEDLGSEDDDDDMEDDDDESADEVRHYLRIVGSLDMHSAHFK